MRRRLALCVTFIGLGGLVLSSISIAASQHKEVRNTRFHVDGGYGDLPSLEAIVAASEAAVLGEVVASRPSNIAPHGLVDKTGDFFSTAYSLKIHQVLRWSELHGPTPTSLEVEVRGVGEVDRGAYIQRYSSERYRELARGRVYVLFINQYALGRPPDARIVWVPATGDGQSIIEIRAGNVAPQSATPLALRLAMLTPAALFEKIKQIPR